VCVFLPISQNNNELHEKKICLEFSSLRFLNKKSDFWPTVWRFWYGLHAFPSAATADCRRQLLMLLFFLQEQKSFKKKRTAPHKISFFYHHQNHAVNKAQPTLP